jgi:Spy/CpxP family protein refolding chaperone
MKILLLCLTLLAVACPLRAASAPATARTLPGLMPAPEFVLQHESELGLSPEQHAKLEAAITELADPTRRLEADVRAQSDALAALLAREKPDEAAVRAQFEKLLAAENEVKRARLTLSLQTRAVLTAEQQGKVAALNGRTQVRTIAPEQQELTAKMERVRALIERTKQQGGDLSTVREMWKRVDQLTRDGKRVEAGRVLDETAQSLENNRSAPPARP